MPPKGSNKRPKPYEKEPRKSARQATKAARVTQAEERQESGELNSTQVIAVPPPETHNNTAQSGQHVRAPSIIVSQPPSINEPQPGTSADSAGDSIPQLQTQVNTSVSRTEFQQLKDSMSSMRDMLSNFMGNFNPTRSNVNANPIHDMAVQPHAFQRPPTVPVEAPIILQQPQTSHPFDFNLPGPSQVPISTDQAASNLVNQALAAHVQSVSGDKIGGKSDKSYQLDRHIPQNLMQDIWEEKYVDLELLLDKKEDPTAPIMLKSIQSSQLGELIQVVKPKPPKGITNIDQWSHAFNIYTSMYTRKYTNQTHNLLTYASKIRELASKGGDYIRYDEEFRRSRARFGNPWEIPDIQLWVDCNQAGLQTQVVNIINSLNKSNNLTFQGPTFQPPTTFQPPPTSDTPTNTKPKHPNGACYTFHNQGRCGRADCKFSHLCYNQGCGQSHSVYTCPKSPGSGLGDSSPPRTPTGSRRSSGSSSHPGSTR